MTVVSRYAKVVNSQINPNQTKRIDWTGLKNTVSLDNVTQPLGWGQSSFTKQKISTNKSVLKTDEYKYNYPYYVTAHDFGLNLPKNAYVNSVTFIPVLKANKKIANSMPRVRFCIYGDKYPSKYSNTNIDGNGFYNGLYTQKVNGNLPVSEYANLRYTMTRSDWVKGKFKPTDLNEAVMGVDLIFNEADGNGTVSLKWVKLEVDYIVPEYSLDYNINTTENNPFVVDAGEVFTVDIKLTHLNKAPDSKQTLNVDLPVGLIVKSAKVLNNHSTCTVQDKNTVKWVYDGTPNADSTLRLTLVSYNRDLQYMTVGNKYIGYNNCYVYVNDSDVSGGQYDLQVTHDTLRYGQPACFYVDANVLDNDGSVGFQFYDIFDTTRLITDYNITFDENKSSNNVSFNRITSNGEALFNVEDSLESKISFKICYKTPSKKGEGVFRVKCTEDENPVDTNIIVDEPYKFVVRNTLPTDQNEYPMLLDVDKFVVSNHRVATETETLDIVLTATMGNGSKNLIMNPSRLKCSHADEIDYIGCIPLEHGHFEPKSTFKDGLLNKTYKNKTYMGKEGSIDEEISLNVRLRPAQVTTLQGLIKMDKPVPINTCHTAFEGDALNHRGWVELYGVQSEKTNPLWYKCKIDVKYITHNINTKFNIVRDKTSFNITDFPSLLIPKLEVGEAIGNDEFFKIDTDGDYYFDESNNIFTLSNGQSLTIESVEKLKQSSEVTFNWLTSKISEDMENNFTRLWELVDSNGNVIVSYEYYDYDFSDDSDYSCTMILTVNDETIANEEIHLNRIVAFEDEEEADDEEEIFMYGSSLQFALNNSKLSILDTGFNGKEYSIEDIQLDEGEYYIRSEWKNLNTDADNGGVTSFIDIELSETALTSQYTDKYNKLVVSPCPIPYKTLVFTREAEEGTLFYYLDDGGVYKYLLEPYYQYMNGVDLRTAHGTSIFDLDNSYATVYIENGLVSVGFNRLNGDMYLAKYDPASKTYINTHNFSLGSDVKFDLKPISDDRIDMMVNDSVVSVWRGHPYVFISHENMDIKILDKFNRVFAENVGGELNDYPVMWDLLNHANLYPNLSSKDMSISEVDGGVDISDLTISAPSKVYALTDTSFTIDSLVTDGLSEEVPIVDSYTGLFGEYSIDISGLSVIEDTGNSASNISLWCSDPITQLGEEVTFKVTVTDDDGNPVSGEVVEFYVVDDDEEE